MQRHAWEQEYKRNWESLQENELGHLVSTLELDSEISASVDTFSDSSSLSIPSKRVNCRHIILIVDLSDSVFSKCIPGQGVLPSDTFFNKLALFVHHFYEDFFQLNPLGKVSLIIAHSASAQIITSFIHPKSFQFSKFKSFLSSFSPSPSNSFSLQNALQCVITVYRTVINQGSNVRCFLLSNSIRTIDPGNIDSTIDHFFQLKIPFSALMFRAPFFVLDKLIEKSQGKLYVAQNFPHIFTLLTQFCISPSQITEQDPETSSAETSKNDNQPYIAVAFPRKIESQDFFIPLNGFAFSKTGYECPVCLSRHAEIPTECPGCHRLLIDPLHFGKSYKYLFPSPRLVSIQSNTNNQEVPNSSGFVENILDSTEEFKVYECTSCSTSISQSCSSFSECQKCGSRYCNDCAQAVPASGNCIGCLFLGS